MRGRILVGAGGLALLLMSSRMAQPPESTPSPPFPVVPEAVRESPRINTSDYVWPTNASRIVTSTFGEYRATHFHAGIDISTNERRGYPVYAARDGYVANIAVSPTSYGKSLTINHGDGFATVYMHLERFNGKIQARAESEQRRLGRYPIDIDCRPGEFPVRKGATIAYTGNTGSGPAHLHFEVRDSNRQPVNPLLFKNFISSDGVAPTMLKVAFIPLSQRSLINGRWTRGVFTPDRGSDHSWEVSDTIQITGEAGLAISVRDRADDTHHTRGVYAHKLYLDDSLVFAVQLDRLPFRAWQLSGLYFDWALRDMGEGKFERLYADSQDDLPFYVFRGNGSGILSSTRYSPGVHRFRIVSTDFNNNSSVLSGHLIMTDLPNIRIEGTDTEVTVTPAQEKDIRTLYVFAGGRGDSPWALERVLLNPFLDESYLRIFRSQEDSDAIKVIAENSLGVKSFPVFQFMKKSAGHNGSLRLDHELCSDFVRVVVSADRPCRSVPSLTLYEGNASRPIELYAVDPSTYVGTYRPSESFQGMRRLVARADVDGYDLSTSMGVDLYPILPGSSGTYRVDNGRLTVRHDSLSVFKTVFLQIDRQGYGEEVSYRLLPEYTVLRRGVDVAVRVDPSKHRRGLFFRGRGGASVLASASSPNDTILTGYLGRTFGELSVCIDNDAPTVRRFRIRTPLQGRPKISFGFGDNLAGIEYDELKMYIDGNAVIPEIDGEHNRASYQVARALKRGTHLLQIGLADRLGNSRTVEERFTVR